MANTRRGNQGNRGAPGTRAKSGGSSQRSGNARIVETNSGGDLCGMCNICVDNEAIGCDTCSKWYHPNPTCVGLPLK